MPEILDARLAQAHGGELGHLDFLQVLCQDEITRRETVAFQRRLQRAKFEQQVTLEEFDFTASSKLPATQIRILADLAGGHADRTWEKRICELVRPTSSSSTTSLCGNCLRPRPTTSTNSSPRGRDAR
ncbi:ATP-binding protein [Streptomyces sp. NPDC003737]|uniref:ATP-binding protein n=1 Tax=Streptomyces sp. NPDC003737 TaxID=3364685 RepID=UPI00367D2D0A